MNLKETVVNVLTKLNPIHHINASFCEQSDETSSYINAANLFTGQIGITCLKKILYCGIYYYY
jgi:hypothetical protein